MTSVRSNSCTPRLQLHSTPQSPNKIGSGLTFSRGWLVRIANETVQIARDGHYQNQKGETVDIKEALHHSLEQSVHYHSSHTFDTTQEPLFDQTEFHVCYGTSLQVAKRLRDQLELCCDDDINIGILNSASGKRPEKFLRGTLSQEEGICRASLLYPCLLQYYNKPHHFYYVNHKPKYQESTSSCAIYSPNVPVIRHDSMAGELLEEYETYSIVSIPAPNAFALGDVVPKAQKPGSSTEEPYETMTLQEAMHDRIFRALSIFSENHCTDLVLCAFGCGAHGNCPRQIAQCFKELLVGEFRGRFRTVAFSIHPSRPQNYEQFVQVLLEE